MQNVGTSLRLYTLMWGIEIDKIIFAEILQNLKKRYRKFGKLHTKHIKGSEWPKTRDLSRSNYGALQARWLRLNETMSYNKNLEKTRKYFKHAFVILSSTLIK